MAHITLKHNHESLVERINRFPLGAPPTELLFKILSVLFSDEEAGLVSLLPIKPFEITAAARIWEKSSLETQRILETLASRGMLLDVEEPDGTRQFVLPPPMAGFFEFSLMRTGNGYDQKLLSELYYQYLNVEEDFVRELFTVGETRLGRVFVSEKTLSPLNGPHVLDYERTTEVIRTATHIGIGTCYCRHKMWHLDRACDAPMEICMTFNGVASSLIKYGIARQVEVLECMDLLDQAGSRNLVQFGENVRDDVGFICNCCGCCCEAMLAAKRFAYLHPINTTNFIPRLDAAACTGCGKCVEVCPVESMGLVSANDPLRHKRKVAKVDNETCLGCGVCVRVCAANAITLESRGKRVITPVNSAHKAVLMAIERGNLQNLIFDNRAMWSHRAMAAILGVILKLPPAKQIMASKQMKSVYLERLLSKHEFSS
jgi:ferredoxin